MYAFKKAYTVITATVPHSDNNSRDWSNQDMIDQFNMEFHNIEVINVEWYDDFFEVTFKDFNDVCLFA